MTPTAPQRRLRGDVVLSVPPMGVRCRLGNPPRDDLRQHRSWMSAAPIFLNCPVTHIGASLAPVANARCWAYVACGEVSDELRALK
jgi:hypothetical protein